MQWTTMLACSVVVFAGVVTNLCMQARQLAAAAAELAESDKQKAKCVMLEGRAWHALRSAREAARCYTQACH